MDRIQGISLFIRVVETGSFSKAASSLGITQPTATKHVAALEKRLGSLLLHRSTRGVTPTEIGKIYYEKCKTIIHEVEDAENLAGLLQSEVQGKINISSSVAFGRRVLTPLVLEFMKDHPQLQVSLNLDDRYINLVEEGVDLAIRMGRLSDSSLGARFLGLNPWVLVATPEYLMQAGTPSIPSDLSRHTALIYSSVQGDHLSALLSATRQHLGIAALPWYVAYTSVQSRHLKPLLEDWTMPAQEIHAVYSSPRLLTSKVSKLIDWLAGQFKGNWWAREIGS
jgi:DNA-binding transcriptional LysR family regulator